MMSYTHDFPRQPMLLVTTDRDFGIHYDHYTILSAIRSGLWNVLSVAKMSHAYWIWEHMQRGCAFHLRRVGR